MVCLGYLYWFWLGKVDS